MYIDHDVLINLIPCEHPFTFYPVVDISEPYLFVFLRMLQELSELPYTLEVLHVDIDETYRIPTAQLYSGSPKNEIDPILDRYGALIRQVAGLSSERV